MNDENNPDQIDFDAIIAKRAERAPRDEERRQAYLVGQAILAEKRSAWLEARERVRDHVARGQQPNPDDLRLALANPDRPPQLDAAKLLEITNAKRRVRKAASEGKMPDPADVLLVMQEDEE